MITRIQTAEQKRRRSVLRSLQGPSYPSGTRSCSKMHEAKFLIDRWGEQFEGNLGLKEAVASWTYNQNVGGALV